MPFFLWSKTAANNANSDPTINWAEGQSPSSVNDSARAQMARTAEWRDDISGTITTGGSSTAYTVTSNQIFDSLAHMNGAMIKIIPHTTCGATVTLNVDTLGAKPLRSSPGVELPSGTIVQGTPYSLVYNNSDGAFYLDNFYVNPFNIPIGGFLPYLGASAPNSNFVLPFGQAISRTTFSTLFALISTTFGVGDGSSTFNVPDLRGRMIAGLDNMGGSTAGRITVAGGNFNGTTLGATGGSENHILLTAEIPAHSHGVTDGGHTHNFNSTTQGNNISTIIDVDPSGGGSFTGAGAARSMAVGIANAVTNISINNAGGGGAHTVMNPVMVMPYILRVI